MPRSISPASRTPTGVAKRWRHSLDRCKPTGASGHGGIPDDCDPRHAGGDLLEQFQPFPAQAEIVRGETSGVTARTRQARNPAAADRIDDGHEDNRHRLRRLLQGADGRARRGKQDIRLERDQFRRISRTLHIARGPAVVDAHIAANGPSQLLQALRKRRDTHPPVRIVLRLPHQRADAPHPFALLRARCEWPCNRRAAEKRDELAASHSMTSSASARRFGGTSRPSAFAVFRLITSSNLVGCMTGRSAGFSPLRMRPT
jgi:hypothetical protein